MGIPHFLKVCLTKNPNWVSYRKVYEGKSWNMKKIKGKDGC